MSDREGKNETKKHDTHSKRKGTKERERKFSHGSAESIDYERGYINLGKSLLVALSFVIL